MGRSEGNAFVGRSAELATARELLGRAHNGPAAVLVVGGEAGVGRTRFVEAVAESAAAEGYATTNGACLRLDAGVLPYASIIAALRGLARGLDEAALAATLGASRREVARLLPEVARIGAAPSSPTATPIAGRSTVPVEAAAGGAASRPLASAGAIGLAEPEALARLRLFEAVGAWLERLAAARPILFTVEDLQWADPATLDLVRSLARTPTTRFVLVATLRTDHPAPADVQVTIAELVRDGATRLELAPFDATDIARLVAGELGRDPSLLDPATVDRVVERSGGNPFLALELVDAGLAEDDGRPTPVPPSLRDILDAELASLDDDTLRVLRAAALHPGPIDDGLLAEVLDLPVETVGDALREAREAGVVATEGGGGRSAPRFRHALQRDVLVEKLGPGERRALHSRFADALERGPADPSTAAAIAHHRDAAGDARRTFVAHVHALVAADDSFAFAAAAGHAEAAATLAADLGDAAASDAPDWPPVRLLDRASLDALLAGDAARSAALARRGLGLATDGAWSAVLHDRLRWALWEAGDDDGARAELDLAVAGLGDAGSEDDAAAALRARLTAEQAAVRMDDADPHEALGLADAAIDAARRLGARDVEALALGVRGRTLAMHGRVDDGLESLRAGIAIADELGSHVGRLVGVSTVIGVLATCGRSRPAREETDAALALADRSGLARSLGAQLQAAAARASFSLGDWEDADRRIADGLARRPASATEARLRTVALRLAAARGDRDVADALDARLTVLEPVLGSGEDRQSLDLARAERALADGRPADVRPLVDRAVGRLETGAGPTSPLAWLGILAVRAEVELALGGRATGDATAIAEATRRIDSIASLATRDAAAIRAAWGPRADAFLADLVAERSRLGDDPAARTAAWERSVEAWEGIERPAFAAYARYRLAEARLAAGAPRSAVAEALRLAAGVLRGLGARSLLAAVERLARLARVDLTQVSAVVATPDALAALDLTPREREVLRLVAAGWSNARIGSELGISAKTASVHVSNILGKLGVANRVEAAALAHRLGVVGAG